MNAITQTALPAIGQPFEGGIFAGITLEGDERRALVLLPGDEEKNHAGATAWAAAQGGAHSSCLPSRIDGLVLFKNLPKEFQREWYWTDEAVTGYADYAWFQSFDDGYQDNDHKSTDCRCRAVRRVAI